jgi:hypothetical protein
MAIKNELARCVWVVMVARGVTRAYFMALSRRLISGVTVSDACSYL